MKVADVMKKEAPLVEESTTIAEAAKVLLAYGEDMAIVCTKGKPIGMITGHDITCHLGKGGSPKMRAAKIMSSPIISITPYAEVEEVLLHMDAGRIRKYPVIMGSRAMGTVSLQSIVEKQNANIRFHRLVQDAVLVLFVFFEGAVFALHFLGGST